MAMLGEDRETAFQIFSRAEQLTPHSMLTLGLGATAAVYDGHADRAIGWGERALRLSPIDQMTYVSYHAMSMAHFLREEFEESAQAGKRAMQASPNFSMCHFALVEPLANLGRMDEAKAAVKCVKELTPLFS